MARVSNVYGWLLFILEFNKLCAQLCDASKPCLGFSRTLVLVRRMQIPKTKKQTLKLKIKFEVDQISLAYIAFVY